MLEAHEVSFSYGGRRPGAPLVLDRVSLRLERGAIAALLGPNGSGKSTLIRLMAGIVHPLAGEIRIEGRSIGQLTRRDVARRLAVVPQETQTTFDFSVIDMVLMGRYAHLGPFELEAADDLAIARDALAATGTGALESRPFSSLSGGEKQRVVIASALAQASDLLLLDEPTASLDPGYQLDVTELLTSLNRSRGLTIVLASHDLNLAASVCRDLVMLRAGTIIASGPTDTVLTGLNLERLYDVRADVRFHDGAGHLTVVPLGRRRG